MTACMGGWCRMRDECSRYDAPDPRNASERLCFAGRDGEIDPERDDGPLQRRRPVGTWERISVPGLLRPAEPFDALQVIA